jgi:hypothetical protein
VNDAVGGFDVPVGAEGDVRVQAHKVKIHRMEKTRFLRIEIYIPFQIIRSNDDEVKKVLIDEINIPVLRTGIVKWTFWKETS